MAEEVLREGKIGTRAGEEAVFCGLGDKGSVLTSGGIVQVNQVSFWSVVAAERQDLLGLL